MVLSIQLIGAAFMLVMLYLTFLFYKRSTYARGSFIVWSTVWIIGILMLLVPEPFSRVVQELKFARATDFYLTTGLMFFAMITFLNYALVKRQERRMEDLVRAEALRTPQRAKKKR